jgi:hypothetical protein
MWGITALVLLLLCALFLSLSDMKSSSYGAFSLSIALVAALMAGRAAAAEGRIGVGYALALGIVFGLLPGLIGFIVGGDSFSLQRAASVFALTVLGVLLGTRLASRHPAGRAFHSSFRRKQRAN